MFLALNKHIKLVEMYHGIAILYYPRLHFPSRSCEYEYFFMKKVHCRSVSGARQSIRKALHEQGISVPPRERVRTSDTGKHSLDNRIKAAERWHKKDLIARYYNREAKRSGS